MIDLLGVWEDLFFGFVLFFGFLFYLFIYFFCLFRPAPVAHGSLSHSHSNASSFNPLHKVRDWTRVFMDTSWVHYCRATTGTPGLLWILACLSSVLKEPQISLLCAYTATIVRSLNAALSVVKSLIHKVKFTDVWRNLKT